MFAVSLSRALLRDAASFAALLSVAIQVAFTDEVEYIVHEYIEEEWPQDGSLGYPFDMLLHSPQTCPILTLCFLEVRQFSIRFLSPGIYFQAVCFEV